MSYTILAFDGLQVPIYLQRGDEQNMGTGSAQTDFRQVPGGGFYRMRRGKRSPQGIRPVTKSGVLWGESAADLRQQLDAWRSKIGVYGRLTVRFFDGSLRWQWAELQDVDAPVAASNKGNYVPISLTWQTAAQYWHGIVWGDSWTIGDGSFVLGDGTKQIGQAARRINLIYTPETEIAVGDFVLTQLGNVDAPADITVTAANAVTAVKIYQFQTTQYAAWTGSLAAGESLRLRSSDLSVAQLGPLVGISTVSGGFSYPFQIVTLTPHGLTEGDSVEIVTLRGLNGVFHNISLDGPAAFSLAASGFREIPHNAVTVGDTIRRYVNAFGATVVTDAMRFMTVKPGHNQITVNVDTAGSGDTALLEYTDAYA